MSRSTAVCMGSRRLSPGYRPNRNEMSGPFEVIVARRVAMGSAASRAPAANGPEAPCSTRARVSFSTKERDCFTKAMFSR